MSESGIPPKSTLPLRDYDWWYEHFIEHAACWEDEIYKRTRFDPETGCWLWTGPKDRGGYARRSVSHGRAYIRNCYVHCVAFEMFHGGLRIGEGFDVDHKCQVRHCLQPAHLQQITKTRNAQLAMHSRYYGWRPES